MHCFSVSLKKKNYIKTKLESWEEKKRYHTKGPSVLGQKDHLVECKSHLKTIKVASNDNL